MNYCILLFLLLVSCQAGAPALSNEPSGDVWVVASDLDNYPFAGVDDAGDPLGRDVEMMEQLADRCSAEIVWLRLPFDELLESLHSSEADMVCATMGITPERARVVDFTDPYFATEIAVVLRAGFGESPSLGERLAGRPVHAGIGTTSESAVREFLPKSKLALAPKAEQSSSDQLLSGSVDALVMDGPAALATVERSNGNFVLAAESLTSEDYAIVLEKDRSGDLLARLNRALAELEREGALAELNERFGVQSARTGSR